MINNSIRVLLAGSGTYAIPIFKSLADFCHTDDKFELVGILTQPDQPAGRGRHLTPSPFKQYIDSKTSKLEIPIFSPIKLADEAISILDKSQPALIVVVDYGQMIPDVMLDYPQYKCLNIHHSLLPLLRGATPVPSALLQGFSMTGTTIQIMRKELDAGEILAQKEFKIDSRATTASLGEKLSNMASQMLIEILPAWIGGQIKPRVQDKNNASYCQKDDIAKSNARLDWQMSNVEIDRRIRAFNPNPIAWTTFRGQRIKILSARPAMDSTAVEKSGQIVIREKKLVVSCDESSLEILEVQPAGKKILSARDFLNGYRPKPEERFE